MRLTATLILPIALAGGCAPTGGDYCDIARPVWFGSDAVVDYLQEADPDLLRGVVVHNEQVRGLCR
jgi:hypothetical protein